MQRLAIIVPALNEAAAIVATLQSASALRALGAQVVVVDGGSSDGTPDIAAPLADFVLTSGRGRARQMNAGAAATPAEWLLFLHADTRLPSDAADQLGAALAAGARWGRFDVRIAGRPALLRLIGALMNARSRLTGIATGDQAIFIQRDVFEQIGGFADQPLMEDIELSRRLLALARPACLRGPVLTSGRRWEQRGVWRTVWLMWRLRWRYWRGDSPQALAELYK